jgi:transglutaminase-like putative cysteine protease
LRKLILIFVSSLLFPVLASQHPTKAETKVLTGKHAVIYDIVNPLGVEYLPNYSNNSYKQELLMEDEFSKRILVEIDLSTLLSKAKFPISSKEIPHKVQNFLTPERTIQIDDGMISAKARELVKEARYVHEAFAAIADWIIDKVTYDAGPHVRQDAKSVMITRRGSCVGLTHLSIAMLRSVGIPAQWWLSCLG